MKQIGVRYPSASVVVSVVHTPTVCVCTSNTGGMQQRLYSDLVESIPFRVNRFSFCLLFVLAIIGTNTERRFSEIEWEPTLPATVYMHGI